MLNKKFKDRWKIDKIITHKWVTDNNKVNLQKNECKFVQPVLSDYKAAISKIEPTEETNKDFNQILPDD